MRDTLIVAFALAALTISPVKAQTPTPSEGASASAQTVGQPGTSMSTAPTVSARVTVGASIIDGAGAAVGTVVEVNGNIAVVDTGSNKVGIPVGSFAQGASGLVIGSTQAELDAAASKAVAQSQAQLQTLLSAGTDVHGINGQVLGTVKATASDFITVTSTKGGDVRLPRAAFTATPAGLTIGLAKADFDKAVAAARK